MPHGRHICAKSSDMEFYHEQYNVQWCDKCETVLRVFLLVLVICFLVRNIDTWTFGTSPQYIFPLYKCMIILRICAHCILCHIRRFVINMTPMWHHCIFIYFIYVMWFFTRIYALIILAFIFQFFKYLSRQDSNDKCII